MSKSESLEKLDRQPSIDFTSIEEALAHRPEWDIIQIKYDGIWSRLEVGEQVMNNIGFWYSRTGEQKKTAPIYIPGGTYVGELMFGSHWAQQDEHKNKSYLFDCVWDGDNDLRSADYARRYGVLRDRVRNANDPTLQVVNNFDIRLAAKLWEKICAAGYEGLIFRRSTDPYSAGIGRLKREITCEYVVMGIESGRGKHVGRMGALLLGLYIGGTLTQSLACGGGFTDRERQEIWDRWPGDRGRVIECKGRARFPSGALRHPNFARFRDDKRPEECVWTIPTE